VIQSTPLDITVEHFVLNAPIGALQGALSYCHTEVRNNGIEFSMEQLDHALLATAPGAFLAWFSTRRPEFDEVTRSVLLDHEVRLV
jgi:hypothetical protein